ncbi:MAG TPA: VOC family protein [Thermomicrobiales bacterium]|nr:VOC family protein [Thermomicrobiales bacterium]
MMEWKLEVVSIPVADADRAKHFYAEQLGFVVDLDTPISDDIRLVQLTPPGSGCSIHLNSGLRKMPPGMLEGLVLMVADIAAAREHLVAGGVDVSPVRHMEAGEWVDGPGGDWNSFMFFSDPDGNAWTVQERPSSG